jgi:hypothetical protein
MPSQSYPLDGGDERPTVRDLITALLTFDLDAEVRLAHDEWVMIGLTALYTDHYMRLNEQVQVVVIS